MGRKFTKRMIECLVASLQRRLARQPCARSFFHVYRWCHDTASDWDDLQEVLEDRGAYCDCEALARMKNPASVARHTWPNGRQRLPRAIDPQRVGSYPAHVHAGGGYVWDAVLEYRVWCCPEAGAEDLADGSDYFYSFPSYPAAFRFSQATPGADEPIALVVQNEYLDEPRPGKYRHVKRRRLTEWPIEFLSRPRRTKHTIPEFLCSSAPENRLDILRGLVRQRR